MCWDERTSWTTFVLGTVFNVFNIFYFRDPVITVISILWEWVLMMQFFEAKAWGSQPSGKGPCSVQNKNAAAGALVRQCHAANHPRSGANRLHPGTGGEQDPGDDGDFRLLFAG